MMKTEVKVIRSFLEREGAKTIREIAKQIKSDYRITYIAVQRLLNKGMLLSKAVGKSTLCELNPLYYGIEIYEAENERKESLLKNRDIRQLYKEAMGRINSSLFVFLVFGSYAKGRQTKSSDIDLMFISNNKAFEKNISTMLSLLPLPVHFFVFSEKEFIKMKDSKKPNVVQEAMKNNIILYGIESYYRLKNA